MFYNQKGEEITSKEWQKLFNKPGYQIIEQKYLNSGYFVSTVWIGIEHGKDELENPLIFETAVVDNKGEPGIIFTDRYSSLAEAKKGHKILVESFNNSKKEDE